MMPCEFDERNMTWRCDCGECFVLLEYPFSPGDANRHPCMVERMRARLRRMYGERKVLDEAGALVGVVRDGRLVRAAA